MSALLQVPRELPYATVVDHVAEHHCRCRDCGKLFEDNSKLDEHNSNHCTGEDCGFCGMIFDSLEAFHAHLHVDHVRCGICNKWFADQAALAEHSKGLQAHIGHDGRVDDVGRENDGDRDGDIDLDRDRGDPDKESAQNASVSQQLAMLITLTKTAKKDHERREVEAVKAHKAREAEAEASFRKRMLVSLRREGKECQTGLQVLDACLKTHEHEKNDLEARGSDGGIQTRLEEVRIRIKDYKKEMKNLKGRILEVDEELGELEKLE